MRVYILDDCEILRLSLSLIIQGEKGMEVVCDAGSSNSAMCENIITSGCTTLLVGLRLRHVGGLEIARQLRKAGSRVAIIALGFSTDMANLERMYKAGIDAFVSISSSNEEIIHMILSTQNVTAIADFSATTSSDRLRLAQQP